MQYYVYILKSLKDQKHYVGLTHDIDKRLLRHNSGRELATKSRIPFTLIYQEICEDRKSARIREKYWKSGAGRENISKLMADLPLGKQKADLPAGRRARKT